MALDLVMYMYMYLPNNGGNKATIRQEVPPIICSTTIPRPLYVQYMYVVMYMYMCLCKGITSMLYVVCTAVCVLIYGISTW